MSTIKKYTLLFLGFMLMMGNVALAGGGSDKGAASSQTATEEKQVMTVTLPGFSAVMSTENYVTVNWKVPFRKGKNYFELQKQVNGSFESIRKIEETGTEGRTAHYTFIDINPQENTNIYRVIYKSENGMNWKSYELAAATSEKSVVASTEDE